jgi:hypothetical protein
LSGIGEKDVQEISNDTDPVGLGWVGGATPTGILAENNYYFVAPNTTEIYHINQIHQILFQVESASMTPNLNVGDLVVT